jgi:hypothetical protein
MTPFEEELKQALQRQEPPADFTARVLARCTEERPKHVSGFWRMGLVAAAALLMLVGGTAYQQREHEAKGLAAKRQLLLAVRIAGTKLQEVQQRVKESEQEQ